MKKILIFKTDKIGDLINISSILKNLNDNIDNCEITLICSEYNHTVAKYYNFLHKIVIYKKIFPFFLITNFKIFFFKKYDLILQLDGKKRSYLCSIFIRAKKKAAVRFLKKIKIFNFSFISKRPSFLVSLFFDYLEDCVEDYSVENNVSYHYLNLYLNILKFYKFKITSINHHIPFKACQNKHFDTYTLIHIDERWSFFSNRFLFNFEKKIQSLSISNNIIITCNYQSNDYFNKLLTKIINNNKVILISKTEVKDLINLIYYSSTVISSHTGLIVHIAACFKKKIIDIVSPDIFNELDRWIPNNSNYTRYKLDDFDNL